jgi:hypothetical protein
MIAYENETLQEYRAHLSIELRKLFDAKGYELVEQELLLNHFSAPEKRMAAVAWMAEQREQRTRGERVKFWIPVVLSSIAICISIVALVVKSHC